MSTTTPEVDAYLSKAKTWQPELTHLRALLLGCDLTEDLKWGTPCYTLEGANIVLMHTFKDYCALLFFKGALMKDPKGILVQQTRNTQAARQIRFTGVQDIVKLEAAIKACVREAIKVEKAGLKVAFKETAAFAMPAEFQNKLDRMPDLKKAFEALTPGRQRAYLLHFAEAKQSATRAARVDKCTPRILDGKGLNDK
ncbi:MAG: DUF1801 domain-containing protein [Aquabacterium sp.]